MNKDESTASRNQNGHSGRTSPSIWNRDDDSFKSYLQGRRNESLNCERETSSASSWKGEERSFKSYSDKRTGQNSAKCENEYGGTISDYPENDESNFKYSFNERKSLANSRHRKSTIKFEIVDDRFRDDRPENIRKYHLGRRPSDGDKSRLPISHAVRENSGDEASRRTESPEVDMGKNVDESAHDQVECYFKTFRNH